MERFLKILTVLVFVFALVLTSRALIRIVSTLAPDFQVLWTAARDLPTHNNPYLNKEISTGLAYPPNTLLFYLPLISYPYLQAQAIFVLISIFSIVGSVYLSLKIVLDRVPVYPFLFALSLTLLSFPTKFTLGMGQVNSIAFFSLLLGFYFYKQEKSFWAGIFLGTAAIFKTIFLFFFLFFLIKRKWKILFYSGLFLLISLVLVFFVSKSDTNLYQFYINEAILPYLNLSGREIYYNQGITGFVSRLTESLFLRKYISFATSLLLIGLTTFLSLRKKAENLQFSLFIIILLLIDSLSWQHHFVWLIFPFIVLVNYCLRKRLFLNLILIWLSYLFVSWNFKNPLLFTGFPKNILLSNTFYGALTLCLLNLSLLTKLKKE